MGKQKAPPIEYTYAIDPKKLTIVPGALTVSDEFPNGEHKLLVLSIGTVQREIRAAISHRGMHEWLLRRFSDVWDDHRRRFKRDDVEAFGGTVAMLEAGDTHALVVNGRSSGFPSIPARIGMELAHRLSEIFRQWKDSATASKKPGRDGLAWNRLDWDRVGTDWNVSKGLILQKIRTRGEGGGRARR